MQRNKGFLNLEESEIIRICDAKRDGKNCVAWLKYDNKEVLFKAGTEENSIAEMFWSYALTKLEKSNVGYDLAKYNSCYGVITQNYNPQKQDSCSLADMIFKYRDFLEQTERKNYCFDRLYNLKDLKKAIDFNFREKYDAQSLDNLNREILELFIIQILLGNGDMHGHNGEIWFPDGAPTVSPYYDFGRYGTKKLKPFIEDYILTYKYQYEDEFEKPIPVFHNFLQSASRDEIELYKRYMERVREIKVKEIFEEMECHIERKLPLSIKRNLTRRLYRNAKASNKYFKR